MTQYQYIGKSNWQVPPEERRDIERRWLEMKLAQIEEIKRTHAVLQSHVERLARHLNLELEEV